MSRLLAAPYRFDFHQAMRVLEWGCDPDAWVGAGSDPRREVVRFGFRLGGGFAASSIQALEAGHGADARSRMSVNFLGLTGPDGPLPAPYAELVTGQAARRDTAPRDFLDMFNHRLISLMVRIRRKHHPALPPIAPAEGPFADYLRALMGLGTAHLQQRLALPDHGLLHYAGLLARRPVGAGALEAMLADYLGVAVRCRPVAGGWYPLAEDLPTVLGPRGRNRGLGRGAVLGRRAWSRQWRFELHLGPMPLARFRALLPGAPGARALADLVRFAAGAHLEVDPVLELAAGEAPAARLGAARLGWSAFLGGGGRPHRMRPGRGRWPGEGGS